MIILFGIDNSGNSVYTYRGSNDELKEHLKIAKEILSKLHNVHYVAIVLQTIHLDFNYVSFDVQLLHLLRRSSLKSPSIEDCHDQNATEIPRTNSAAGPTHNSAGASKDDNPSPDAESDPP